VENPYATFLNPPAPFVLANVAPTTGADASDALLAQLDYGADRTVLPLEVVERLHLPSSGVAMIAGLGGEVEEARLYDVRLTIAGFSPLAVEVLANPGEPCVLLGRDVLNNYRIIPDGPNQRLEIG
jgi:predicted aspartyl protease